jgi:hypothetical protein
MFDLLVLPRSYHHHHQSIKRDENKLASITKSATLAIINRLYVTKEIQSPVPQAVQNCQISPLIL